MRVDTAASFWKKDAPSPANEPAILHQDYLPQHLGIVWMEHGLNGVIAIQHASAILRLRIGLADGECVEVIAAVALVTSDSLPNVPEWVEAFPNKSRKGLAISARK